MFRALAVLVGLASEKGNFKIALPLLEEALALVSRIAPDSRDHANALLLMGNLMHDQGDLAAAERNFMEASQVYERANALPLDSAAVWNNLASVCQQRGDLQRDEEYARRAAAIKEKLAPDSASMAMSLMNLGAILSARGEDQEAEILYRRSLDMLRRRGGSRAQIVHHTTNLASVLVSRHRGEGSPGLLDAALTEAVAPRERILLRRAFSRPAPAPGYRRRISPPRKRIIASVEWGVRPVEFHLHRRAFVGLGGRCNVPGTQRKQPRA